MRMISGSKYLIVKVNYITFDQKHIFNGYLCLFGILGRGGGQFFKFILDKRYFYSDIG